ncbi:MAG: hypothetical protein R2700_10425 [Solirubrobacterales bacterium]
MELPRHRHGASRPGPATALHLCPDCGSDLVHPVEWGPVDACRWRVERRCPECEWRDVAIHDQAALDDFDAVLDAGTDLMVAELRRLQRSNMESELARFNLALDSDLVLPEDF